MSLKEHLSNALLEKLAELEHKQWSHILKYLLKKGFITLAKMQTFDYDKLAQTSYSELSEAQKESDREWARKAVAVFAEHQKEVVSQIPSVTSTAIGKLLKSKKWNNIEEIAEEIDVNVRKNGKIVLDIVNIQGLVYTAIDEFSEVVEKDLKALLEGVSKDET